MDESTINETAMRSMDSGDQRQEVIDLVTLGGDRDNRKLRPESSAYPLGRFHR